MSFRRYRQADLIAWVFIMAITTALAAVGSSLWFPASSYALSPEITIVCLVMMRWGGFSVIHAVVGALVYCLCYGLTGGAMMAAAFPVRIGGSLCGMAALLLLKQLGHETVRSRPAYTILHVTAVYLATTLGRGIISVLLGAAADIIPACILTDLLSLLLALVAVPVARKTDGIYEEQKHYLLRTQKQRDEERKQGMII